MSENRTLFTDSSGKPSPKRIMGIIGVAVGLGMTICKYFLEEKGVVSDTLILGILTASFAAMSMDVFKKQ